ncbi:hypothetical protein WJX75_006814 [Coccomyxa subellipsoidea]|uniref:Uncharacterized protein n=1 Tax=Coccomyxa subellipsoidea TaxID=248742 RepID=A0ABR2YZI0_9CHLO
MTSVHQKFLLCSLEVPNATTLCTSNDAELRQLVAWLEQKLIRQYRPDDRIPVSDTTSERWLQAYQQYLDDLNCPVKHTGAALKSPAVMDWLLHYAVDLMHGDKAKVLSPLSISSSTLEELGSQK